MPRKLVVDDIINFSKSKGKEFDESKIEEIFGKGETVHTSALKAAKLLGLNVVSSMPFNNGQFI